MAASQSGLDFGFGFQVNVPKHLEIVVSLRSDTG